MISSGRPLDDVGPSWMMLDESLDQFKHSYNVYLAFFSWWMMLDAFSRVSNMLDQHLERKMPNSIKFERLNIRMPIRICCSFGQLFLLLYKMGSQSGETVEQAKETIKNGNKKWTDDEVQDLTELLKEKPCLLDIFSNEYTEREVKESAYAELVEHFDSSSAIVKAKINALTAQLGGGMAKESKTTSGQATDEKYVSKWIFYEQLKFSRPAMATT